MDTIKDVSAAAPLNGGAVFEAVKGERADGSRH